MTRRRSAVLLSGAVAALTACRPTPTLPPTFTPQPSATVTSSPSLTSTSASTRTPTTTPTATATQAREPVVVGLDLREAEREALGWFDPTQRARIVWSRYLRREDLASIAMVEDDRPGRKGRSLLLDLWSGYRNPVSLDDVGDTLVGVVVQGRTLERFQASKTERIGSAYVWPPPEEVTVLGLFDARTGERFAVFPIEPRAVQPLWLDGKGDLFALVSAPPALATYRSAARVTTTPTPTPAPLPTDNGPALPAKTPRPTATPSPPRVPLTLSNMPADLGKTFRAYPLVPGSSWTWRVHATAGDVRWVRQIVTETVVAAWREGPNAVVETELAVRELTPGNSGADHIGADAGRHTRFVTPEFILDDLRNVEWMRDGVSRPEQPESPFAAGGIAIETIVTPFYEHIDVGPAWPQGGPLDVTTPAGSFRNCWVMENLGGNGWAADRTFCSGVGYVGYSFTHATMAGYNALDAFLVRWHRAALPMK